MRITEVNPNNREAGLNRLREDYKIGASPKIWPVARSLHTTGSYSISIMEVAENPCAMGLCK